MSEILDILLRDPVRPQVEGNPHYPLPHDYYDGMTSSGQRLARINALTLGKLSPDDFVHSWSFFRLNYLKAWEEGGFYKRWIESPRFHYEIVRDIGDYPLNAFAAPRGSAKSTVIAEELPLLLLLTRPHFYVLLILSRDTMVTKRIKLRIQEQLSNNPLIIRDFGVSKPKRGLGSWNDHFIQMANTKAVLEGVSVNGGILGNRPDLVLVDDAEVDPERGQTINPELVEVFSRKMYHIILPMVDRGETGVALIGTLLGVRCFAYDIQQPGGLEGREEYWNRRLYDIEEDGHGQPLWSAKWNKKFMEEEKELLGLDAYNTQRRNRPGSTRGKKFPIGVRASYWVEGSGWMDHPLDCDAVLSCYPRGIGNKSPPVEMDAAQALQSMIKVSSLDYAKCLTPNSDFLSIIILGGMGRPDLGGYCWFVLDAWVGRIQSGWEEILMRLNRKWGVTRVGIEAIAAQELLVPQLREKMEKSPELWSPQVWPLKHASKYDKMERISSMEPRFRDRSIKLPLWRREEDSFKELFQELQDFDGTQGSVRHDDAADALEMAGSMLKGNPEAMEVRERAGNDVYKLLAEGKTTDSLGLPVLSAIPTSTVTVEMLDAVFRSKERLDRNRRRRMGRSRSGVWL